MNIDWDEQYARLEMYEAWERKEDKMNPVLREKRQIFSDLCIPWDDRIQREFDLEMSKRNNADPQIVADMICHDYIEYAMNHYTETMHKFLKEKTKSDGILYERELVSLIGKESMGDLLKANLITPVRFEYSTRKAYRVNP